MTGVLCRAVVRGGAGSAVGALAPPEFWSSVNPIPTRAEGADYTIIHYC